MSVVNQMLRDLQQRQELPKQLPLEVASLKRNNRLLLSIITLLVISVLVFLLSSSVLFKNDNNLNVDAIPKVLISKAPSDSNKIENSDLQKINSSETPLTAVDNNSSLAVNNIVEADEVVKLTDGNSMPEKLELSESGKRASGIKITEEKKQPENIVSTSNAMIINSESIVQNSAPLKSEIKTIDKINQKGVERTSAVLTTQVKKQSPASVLKSELKTIKNNYKRYGLNRTKSDLLKLLNGNPEFHSARLYLINIVWHQKSIETESLLEQAVKQYPNQSAYILAASRYYIEGNKLEKAENILSRNALTSHRLPELYQLRGHIRQKQNKHVDAISDYVSILNMEPNRGDIYIAIGISFEALRKYKQAHLSYQKAMLDSGLSGRQLNFVESKIQGFSQLKSSLVDSTQHSQGS